MLIISLIDQSVSAEVVLQDGGRRLEIVFSDPAYVRADCVTIDRDSRLLGVVLHEAYHHVDRLSAEIDLALLCGVEDAALCARRPNGSLYSLRVPVSVSGAMPDS